MLWLDRKRLESQKENRFASYDVFNMRQRYEEPDPKQVEQEQSKKDSTLPVSFQYKAFN